MLRTRENSDVFNSLDEIYLVFTSKKQISSIYFTVQVLLCLLNAVKSINTGGNTLSDTLMSMGPRPLGPKEIDGLLVPPGKASMLLTD